MTPELTAALRKAQACRATLAEIDDQIIPLKADYQLAVAPLIAQREAIAADVLVAENELRQLAEAVFASTGNKQPVRGVTVKVFTRLEYDTQLALERAVSEGRHSLLALDKRAFEEYAKKTPLDFVASVQVPMATIAKDLGLPRSVTAMHADEVDERW